MKKIDVLMLKSFIVPFILTTAVADFILLIQYLLKYFDDFIGKNLGVLVFGELIFYFSLNMLQAALPLGVLVASLMTFGNLGEYSELSAIKSAGISLIRILRPIFIFILFLSLGAFYFNNYAIPEVNLRAYSLLYDIKQTKPALDIKAGVFYNGIPNYSIKAGRKLNDGKTLLDVIIYDHTVKKGNKTVILADSCLMYTFMNERYLQLELYNGNYYIEEHKANNDIDQLYRTKYHKMNIVFSLSSFDLRRRKKELFQNNKQMKNIAELSQDIDSFQIQMNQAKENFLRRGMSRFYYHKVNKNLGAINIDTQKRMNFLKAGMFSWTIPFDQRLRKQKEFQSNLDMMEILFPKRKKIIDSITNNEKKQVTETNKTLKTYRKGFLVRSINIEKINLDTLSLEYLDQYISDYANDNLMYQDALNAARHLKVNIGSMKSKLYYLQKNTNQFIIEKHKKYAQAVACILMFLIGAPLGAIIKKGGLGVPVIVAIFFFIIYFVFMSIGEKSSKEGALDPYIAAWLSDLILLPFGLFFLRQAKIDARLFEIDIYQEGLKNIFRKIVNKKYKRV